MAALGASHKAGLTMLLPNYNLLMVAPPSWDQNGSLWPSLLSRHPQYPWPPGSSITQDFQLLLTHWDHCNVSLSA